jgi:hypothetical protein
VYKITALAIFRLKRAVERAGAAVLDEFPSQSKPE